MIKIKKKKPMPLWQKVLYVFSFIFLIGAFIFLGTRNYNIPTKKIGDAEAFSKEYGVPNNNKFKYLDGKSTLDMLKNGTGVIFMGYPESDWNKVYAEMLYVVFKTVNIKEVYYYNFYKDRANKTHVYDDIVEELSSYLPSFDKDTQGLYGPIMVIVKNGTIVYYDGETSVRNGNIEVEEYWSIDKRLEKETNLRFVLSQYIEDMYAS